MKTEGMTDLTLFTEQIPFDAKEPDLIVEEDTYVLQDTSQAVNYKEVMKDFAMRCYLSKPDLAMSMAEPSHWFGRHNSWLTFVGVAAVLVVVLIPFLLFTLYKYCGFRFQFQKINSILAKLLILNKTTESIPPTLAQPMTEFGELTYEMFDLKVLQLVLIVMASTLKCYLLIRITLWIFDYVNTKFLNINSTGLIYLSSLTMDKTNIYLQFSDFTTGECANLYLGTIFGNPEDIYVCGQFVAGRISLDRKFPFDFITLKWDTLVLNLIDLDLPMPTTLQISNWQKSKIRRMFDSSNSYFRIVAHNPNMLKVRAITGAYNLHDEVLEDDMDDAEFLDAPQPDQSDQPIAVVQPALEVVVTDQQHTMTFNGEQVNICEEVENSKYTSLKLLQHVKLKTMFIPLAPTTSTTTSSSPLPSPSTSPLDDGITTVKHYIYIHSQKPRTNATTKMYHFNWQENIKCKSHCIYHQHLSLQMLSRNVWILQQKE